MATKSISQLDTQATANETDLFEVAIADQNSASGYASKKESAETIAQGIVGDYTYPLLMPNMQAKTITEAINQLLANVAAVYDSTQTYAVGAFATHNGQLYKCNTAVDTAETFDPTKWDAGTISDFFSEGGYAAAIIQGRFGGLTYVDDKLSGFTSTGNIFYPLLSDGTNPVYDFSKPFKFHAKIKWSGLKSSSQAIIGNNNNNASNAYYRFPSIEIKSTSATQLIGALWSTNGSSWTFSLNILKSELSVTYGDWVIVELVWDGTTVTFSVDNGTDKVTKSQAATAFYTASEAKAGLGTVAQDSNLTANYVTYDMSDTYWEQDGVILWGNKAS